ncbi:hypothetical protein JHK87_049762 [Glycine soja]|nr:hypothetical protein JHK87_049762 [Glycine soja]
MKGHLMYINEYEMRMDTGHIHLKQETENLMKKIELLKDSKWFIISFFSIHLR